MPLGHGDELVPCLAAGMDDGLVVFPDVVAEVILAQVLPDIFDGPGCRAVVAAG